MRNTKKNLSPLYLIYITVCSTYNSSYKQHYSTSSLPLNICHHARNSNSTDHNQIIFSPPHDVLETTTSIAGINNNPYVPPSFCWEALLPLLPPSLLLLFYLVLQKNKIIRWQDTTSCKPERLCLCLSAELGIISIPSSISSTTIRQHHGLLPLPFLSGSGIWVAVRFKPACDGRQQKRTKSQS